MFREECQNWRRKSIAKTVPKVTKRRKHNIEIETFIGLSVSNWTANDPRCGPQMIPPENGQWHGVCSSGRELQYNTIQYNTIQYNTIQYNTMQCNAMQCNTIQYNTMLYSRDKKIKNPKHLLKGEIVRLALCKNEYPQIKV